MKSRRTKFSAYDVTIKRGVSGSGVGHLSRETINFWVKDFLAAWESGGAGWSIDSERILEACPGLTERVRKFWSGV